MSGLKCRRRIVICCLDGKCPRICILLGCSVTTARLSDIRNAGFKSCTDCHAPRRARFDDANAAVDPQSGALGRPT